MHMVQAERYGAARLPAAQYGRSSLMLLRLLSQQNMSRPAPPARAEGAHRRWGKSLPQVVSQTAKPARAAAACALVFFHAR